MYKVMELLSEPGDVLCFVFYCFCILLNNGDQWTHFFETLLFPVVRRVIVIDPESRRVEGIITLRDVFSFILG